MGAPAAYLRRVLVNEHISQGRRSARRVRTVPEGLDPPLPDTGDPVAARDEAWRWLSTLAANQRAVLVLRFYEDLPDAEIAELLGCPEATVRSHAHRGLAALRGRLDGSTAMNTVDRRGARGAPHLDTFASREPLADPDVARRIASAADVRAPAAGGCRRTPRQRSCWWRASRSAVGTPGE